MSYITLYRKYRPQKFEDVVGQEVVKKVLINSIKDNKIGHAYIFSGPRGTGKTSMAKIFAKAVNCSNFKDDICCECEYCKVVTDDLIDIVEIDAASNNGVGEIREIRNNVKMLPTLLKYKVYIVDEVHMLSNSAFNALLKTLEEPPKHVIFILATTEINQIPKTVLSRCQKFDFKKISNENIINRLKYIAKEENIKIEDDVIELIANLSDGGLRDAINLLDQVNSMDKKEITRTDVLNLVGVLNEDDIFNIFNYIVNCDVKNIIDYIENYNEKGINYINLIESLEKVVKDLLIFNQVDNFFDGKYEDRLIKYTKIDIEKLIKMSDELFKLNNEIKRSNNQKMMMEIYLLRIALIFNEKELNNNVEIKKEEKEEIIKDDKKQETTELADNNEIKIKDDEEINKEILINNILSEANKDLKNDFIIKFDSVNEYLTDKKYNNISNLLKNSDPVVVSNKGVIFTFKEDFEVLLFNQNDEEIVKFLNKIYKNKYFVVAISNKEWEKIREEYIENIKLGKKYTYIEPKKIKTRKNKNEFKENVENIFGEDIIKED